MLFRQFFRRGSTIFRVRGGFLFLFRCRGFWRHRREILDEVCLRDVVFAIPIVGVVVDAHEEGAIVPDFGLVSRSDDEVGWVIDIGIDFWCDDL